MLKPPRKHGKAIWTKCFPAQSKALHPEHTKAGGIRARSTPEAIRMNVYRAIRSLYLAANPVCQFVSDEVGRPICAHPSVEIHHRAGRQGWNLVNVKTWLALCAGHHRWIHDHPAEATKLGLLEKR